MFEHHKNVLSLISILFLRKLRLTVEPFSRSHSSYKVQPGIFFFFFFFFKSLPHIRASLIVQLVKNPSEMQETRVGFLGREDLLEKR